jgi:GNAT superfamily N-acetyltransferase
MTLTIIRAETPEDLDAVRDLIRAFFAFAMAELEPKSPEGAPPPPVFAGLDAELAGLPGRFAAPTGCLLLARLDSAPAGCIAYFGHDAATMEVKRMYVRPEARGHGVGEGLVATLLAEARAAGYTRSVLSTHYALRAAHRLYRRAGFLDMPCALVLPTSTEPKVSLCMELSLAS